MEHLFLSKELSLLAREKGFDEACIAYHYKNEVVLNQLTCKSIGPSGEIPAPLYQQIIDWLREKHRIDIHIHHYDTLDKAIEDAFKILTK